MIGLMVFIAYDVFSPAVSEIGVEVLLEVGD